MSRLLKAVLLGGVSLVAMTGNAHAEPISSLLIWGIGTALQAIGIVVSPTLISGLLTLGLAVGSQLISGLLGRPKLDPGQYKGTFESAETSEIRAVGRTRNGGLKAFGNTKGVNRYRLIFHLRGPNSAIEEWYIGGRLTIVESNGAVSSPPYTKPSGGSGPNSYVYIKSKPGDGTETAWTELTTAFPTLWTSAHKALGIHQTLVQYISPGLTNPKFLKLYQNGPEEIENLGRREPVYDPREVTHDVDDASTWEWSDNGVLCAIHIMRSYPNITSAKLDWDNVAAEADKADVLVATKTGTEKRSRCWGMWAPREYKRGDIFDAVLRSIGGEVKITTAGKLWVRLIDDVPSTDLTLTDLDIETIVWASGPEAPDRPNICEVEYYSPERNYEMAEIDLTGIAWAKIDDEITQYGEKPKRYDLPFCPSASQAQRIARRLFLMDRADSGSAITNLVGMAAWGETAIEIISTDFEINDTCVIGAPKDTKDGKITIPFRIVPGDLDAWNPATDEAAAPTQVPEIEYEADIDKPGVPSEATQITYSDNSKEVRTRFTVPTGTKTAEAIYRGYTGGEPDQWSSMTEIMIPTIAPFTGAIAYVAGDMEGEKVDFRAAVYNASDEGSGYTDPLEIASLVEDNTQTAAPTGTPTPSGGNFTAPDDLNVAYIQVVWNITGGSSTTNKYDCYPNEVVTVSWTAPSPAETITVTITARTSDGTASAPINYLYTGPPPGP